ncbi:transcriptional regulator, partial [Kibdelosporangium lantanae]
YPRTDLTDPRLAPVLTAINQVLAGHMPFPAIVVDRYGDIVAHNDSFPWLTEGVSAELLAEPMNAYRIALHPKGMAPRVRNFGSWARHVTERLSRDLDPRVAELAEELRQYVPEVDLTDDHLGFAVPIELTTSRGDLTLMTTVTTFATAVDVTVAELKLEAFLPANQRTAEILASPW